MEMNMSSHIHLHRILFLVFACVFAGPILPLRADTVEEFYKGKRLTIITTASVGGGYDQYARLLARHMSRHIASEPPIIVQNMPGAEGLKAANHIYNVALQDGTIIGGLSRNTGLARFYDFNNAAIQFDARKFQWLGSPQQETGLFIINSGTGISNISDIKNHTLSVSSTAHNSPSSIYARMLNELYGAHLKPIEGYDGSQACLMAVERRETDAHISGGSSAPFRNRFDPWVKSGIAKVILQMGMKRDSAFPDIPTALEIMNSADDRQLFEIAFAEQMMGRPFVMGPLVPKDRVDMLRKAFNETMVDDAFLTDAAREKAEIDPVDGVTINALLDRAYTAPPHVIERLRELAK
jgi:tripartite-type tricarboxylate transporter receptor subunit TctC